MRGGHRLSTAAEFERARKGCNRRADELFAIQWVENGLARPRFGMAVGARTAGGAVERNRVRRLIRESFRLHKQELPAVDVFVMAKNGARVATNPEISASLQRLWHEIRGVQ